jgi:hypothetical protein
MTSSDFALMRLYRNKRGPLNPLLRMEAGHALIASCVYNANGTKKRDGSQFSPSDFMPWAKDEEECASPEQVMALFVSISKAKRNDN